MNVSDKAKWDMLTVLDMSVPGMSLNEALKTVGRLTVVITSQPPAPDLVSLAKATPGIMTDLRNGKKIMAIKALRTMTNCGLVDAKNAIDKISAEEFGRSQFGNYPL